MIWGWSAADACTIASTQPSQATLPAARVDEQVGEPQRLSVLVEQPPQAAPERPAAKRWWPALQNPARRATYRQACDQRLVEAHRGSAEATSFVPTLGFLLNGIGKLVLGRGLGIMSSSFYAGQTGLGVGGGVMTAIGLSMCIGVAVKFGNQVKAIDPILGTITEFGSISATLVIALGNLVRELNHLGVRGNTSELWSLLPLTVGLATMGYTCPTLVSYAKLRKGSLPVVDSLAAGHLLFMTGMGGVYGMLTSGAHLPSGAVDAVVIGTAMCILYSRTLSVTRDLRCRAVAST